MVNVYLIMVNIFNFPLIYNLIYKKCLPLYPLNTTVLYSIPLSYVVYPILLSVVIYYNLMLLYYILIIAPLLSYYYNDISLSERQVAIDGYDIQLIQLNGYSVYGDQDINRRLFRYFV